MPSKSPQQQKLMNAVAHNPKFAQKVGIPQSVGEEFAEADAVAGSAASQPAAGNEGSGHSTPHMAAHQSPMQPSDHPTAGKAMPMTRALMGKKK